MTTVGYRFSLVLVPSVEQRRSSILTTVKGYRSSLVILISAIKPEQEQYCGHG